MARRHPAQTILGPLLAPLSLVYGGAALARRRLAERGIPRPWQPPRFCVSVGNISWGGTGKSPVTDWLLDHAAKHHRKAVVLTRGYGAEPPALPWRVTPDMDPAQTGDEPLMLVRRHPDAMVLVDPNRGRAARLALTQDQPDLFLLDDGFQHIAVGRNLNLVLLDPDDIRRTPMPGGAPSNWNRVIPWGTWREPAAALHAADAFLIKCEPEDWPSLAADLSSRLSPFPRPAFAFRLRPEGLRPCGADTEREIEISASGEASGNEAASSLSSAALPGPYLLLSGVGNPEQVRRTAEAFMGRPPERHVTFPDHFAFATHKDDVLKALSGGDVAEKTPLPVICTAKDAVKLAWLPRLYALDVTAEFFASHSPARALSKGAANRGQSVLPGFEEWLDQRMAHINF